MTLLSEHRHNQSFAILCFVGQQRRQPLRVNGAARQTALEQQNLNDFPVVCRREVALRAEAMD